MITHKTITTLAKAGTFALIGMFTMMSTSSAANIELAGSSFTDAKTAMESIAAFDTLSKIIESGATTGGEQALTQEAEAVLAKVATLKTANETKLAQTVAETFWKVLICKALPEFVTTFFTGIDHTTTTQEAAAIKTQIHAFIGAIVITEYTLALTGTILTVTKTADRSAVATIQLGDKSFDKLIVEVANKLKTAKDFTIDMFKVIQENKDATLTIIQDLRVIIAGVTTTIKDFVGDAHKDIFALIDGNCTTLIRNSFASLDYIKAQRAAVPAAGQEGAGAAFNTAFRTALAEEIATAVNTLGADIAV